MVAAGVLLALAGTVLGEPVLSLTTLACAALGVGGVWVGLRRWRTPYRTPWIAFALAIVLFVSGGIVSELSTLTADLLDAAGYGSAIVAVHLLGRRRDHDRDPTNLVDALIVIGGVAVLVWILAVVPHLQDPGVETSTKVVDLAISALSLVLATVVLRLAIGPGAKNWSYYLLAVTATGALGSDVLVWLDQAGRSSVGAGQGLDLFAQTAFVAMGAAALHPSMTELTNKSAVPVGRLTRGRLVVMLVAVLVAPVALLTKLDDADLNVYGPSLIVGWGLLTALGMTRMAGLVQAREQLSVVERTLNRAAAGLVSATDRDQMQAAAIAAMRQLAGAKASRLRVSVADGSGSVWTVTASAGHRAEDALGAGIDPGDLGLAPHARTPLVRTEARATDLPDDDRRTVVVAPLISSNQLRGALLLSLDGVVHPTVVDGLEALAAAVSLALETAVLTEDLHRRRSAHRFKALVEHSSDIIVVLDRRGRVTYCSPSSMTMLGYSPEELAGTELESLVHASDKHVVEEMVGMVKLSRAPAPGHELRVRSSSDEWKTLEVTVSDLRDDADVDGFVLNAHDVSSRKALEEDLRQRALHDDLTGLPNRVKFRDRVDHALALRRSQDTGTAILFVDLDDFKAVNDGLGHDFGDEVLKVIADRLSGTARAGDTPARLGGDEFGLLLENIGGPEDAMELARRLLQTLQEPVEVDGHEIAVGASLGVAFADATIDSSDVLLRNGDVAMYYAKRTGTGRIRMFDDAMYVNAFERLELKGHMAQALEGGELCIHYQPLVSLRSGEVLGFEALLRWDHPSLGGVSPAAFIPLAEESGLIVPIGSWVMAEAIAQLARWRKASGRDLVMSINLSPRQLEEDGIVDEVSEALSEAGVDASCVTLELTESVGLEEGASRERFVELRRLGVKVAADDFGSGFASYAALQHLPFTAVKIDRSLIDGLDGPHDKALAQVRSIVEMAHATDLLVVAEGIEREAQRATLADMGCDIGQGFLLGRPVPAAEIDVLVASGGLLTVPARLPRMGPPVGAEQERAPSLSTT
ncbi:MAG: EAL domain-containing protein [Acidimicrobiales bacterium]